MPWAKKCGKGRRKMGSRKRKAQRDRRNRKG